MCTLRETGPKPHPSYESRVKLLQSNILSCIVYMGD